jgi:hypothetical protein
MFDAIELTNDEAEKLGDYLYETDGLGWEELARGFIDCLNELRAPDPIGTVRADDDGNVAVKVSDGVNDQWFVHRLTSGRCSSPESFEYLSTWPIVYKPVAE